MSMRTPPKGQEVSPSGKSEMAMRVDGLPSGSAGVVSPGCVGRMASVPSSQTSRRVPSSASLTVQELPSFPLLPSFPQEAIPVQSATVINHKCACFIVMCSFQLWLQPRKRNRNLVSFHA